MRNAVVHNRGVGSQLQKQIIGLEQPTLDHEVMGFPVARRLERSQLVAAIQQHTHSWQRLRRCTQRPPADRSLGGQSNLGE